MTWNCFINLIYVDVKTRNCDFWGVLDVITDLLAICESHLRCFFSVFESGEGLAGLSRILKLDLSAPYFPNSNLCKKHPPRCCSTSQNGIILNALNSIHVANIKYEPRIPKCAPLSLFSLNSLDAQSRRTSWTFVVNAHYVTAAAKSPKLLLSYRL